MTKLWRLSIELTKPGQMRYSWHKRLEWEILLPRRRGEQDRREIKRIDMQLRRKEECRDTHPGGGYFKNFKDKIPWRTTSKTETNPSTNTLKHTTDNESTTSSSPEEPVTTKASGAYPAIPVQQNRHGPIEEITVHNVRINRVIENRAARNQQQEDNVR